MDGIGVLETIFMTVYTTVLVTVSLYGFHRYGLLFLYYRHRHRSHRPKTRFAELPPVTVQLPMYNEQYVARRIIERVQEIRYPREKLQVQVLDDSTDSTCAIARQAVEEAAARGFAIEYIHRTDRTGYKAGALENGLKTATGQFITIFDADFVPDPDILTRSIHHFTDPKVCVVQTRWEHINRRDNVLTRSQAILLDGHFVIEHVARNRSGRFMSFNGTAGTWRKDAIVDAGGWQHDTLTEDMDLSYRAQLKGWKFIFLPELTAPAELPPDMNAFKAQQHRWTKGGTQTAIKLLPTIWRSRAPFKAKVEATFHLTSFSIHLMVILLVLMMFPAIYLQTVPMEQGTLFRAIFDMSVFALATLSASMFYVCSQFELFGTWRDTLKYLPVLMALGVGLAVSNAKAVLEALFGQQSEFVRTPKFGAGQAEYETHKRAVRSRAKFDIVPYIELLMGLYMVACTVASLIHFRSAMSAPFLIIFALGFFYVSLMSFQGKLARRRQRKAAPQPAPEQAPVE